MPFTRFAATAAAALLLLALPACRMSRLTNLTITPGPGAETLSASGQTVQYKAIATYQSGQAPPVSSDVTDSVTWTASNTAVATMSASGVATAVASGKTTITAESSGMLASSDVTVAIPAAPAPPSNLPPSIMVTPATASATTRGETTQFLASGSLDGTGIMRDLTRSLTWVSSNPSVATVSSGGQTTALSSGTATITAGINGVNASAVLTVALAAAPPVLPPSITVVPATISATDLGEQSQFIALGSIDGTGKTQNLTRSVTWVSSNPSVAAVNSSGLAITGSSGTTTITATADGIAASSVLTVTLAPPPPIIPSTITIIPASGAATATALGEATQFIAIGNLGTDGIIQDLTDRVKWSSSDVSVAPIDQNGLATDVAQTVLQSTATTITAEATSSTGTVITATSTLTVLPGQHQNLPVLNLFKVGAGQGSVTSSPEGLSVDAATTCTTAQPCTANFQLNAPVTLTAQPAPGSSFAGWSANCVPQTTSPATPAGFYTQCTVNMVNDEAVGAIFNQP